MWRKRRAIESKAMNLRGKINRIKFYDHQSDSASVGWVSLRFYWLSTASLSLIGLQTRQCAPFCWPEWKHTNPGLMGEMFGKSAGKKHRDERKERWNGHKNLGCEIFRLPLEGEWEIYDNFSSFFVYLNPFYDCLLIIWTFSVDVSVVFI